MLCINSKSVDPYFNLAAEEYFLKNFQENIFMLWVSKPAVIVGKHQNALAELNYDFVSSNEILVARRLSGGGTVYHDSGNLNFTWILNGETGKLVDFKKFINPVIEFLKTLGLDAKYGGRNDILINGLKVSGNAEHVYKKRTLHHGTLLFNANLSNLRGALETKEKKYFDRAVKSVPHSVVNINDILNKDISFDTFRKDLFNYITGSDGNNIFFKPGETDVKKIKALRKEKYIIWDWIFGYSPDYRFEKDLIVKNYKFNLQFHVTKGIISEVIIKSLNNYEFRDLLKHCLTNTKHEEKDIFNSIINSKIHENYKDFDITLFVKQMF